MTRIWLALTLLLAFAPLGAQADEMVETKLYFGLNYDGGTVNKAQWKKFMTEDVTPRFPDGLTIVSAKGQFKDKYGSVIREDMKLLIIVHPQTEKTAKDIAALKAIYIERFKQISVFHTESVVKVVE